jgi:hypothetical protein
MEVASFEDANGRTQVAVVQNRDGAYRVFLSSLRFDDQEQIHYWSDDMMPSGGIYETIDIAKTEIEVLVGPLRHIVRASPERDPSSPSSA